MASKPKDKHGKALAIGNRVIIRAVVVDTDPTAAGVNVYLETEEVLYPTDGKSHLELNGKQVEKQ